MVSSFLYISPPSFILVRSHLVVLRSLYNCMTGNIGWNDCSRRIALYSSLIHMTGLSSRGSQQYIYIYPCDHGKSSCVLRCRG